MQRGKGLQKTGLVDIAGGGVLIGASSALVASSSRSTLGRSSRARVSDSRWRCPPEIAMVLSLMIVSSFIGNRPKSAAKAAWARIPRL